MGRWGGRMVAQLRALVLEHYGARCHWCHQPIDLTLRYPHPKSLSIEHLMPQSRGGHQTDIRNLRPVHLDENLSRGNRLVPSRRPRANPAFFPSEPGPGSPATFYLSPTPQ